MPEYLTPGIYLRPKPEAKRDVRLVRTDIAGFVGFAERGRLVQPGMTDADAKRLPLRITSWKEFRAEFGGFIPNGHLAYAVKGFFENGGKTAYIVRAAATHAQATEQRPREASLMFPAGAPGAPPRAAFKLAADSKAGDVEVEIQGHPAIGLGTQVALASQGVTDASVVVGVVPNGKIRLAKPLSADHLAADTEVAYYATGLRFVARSKGNWGNRIRIVITPLEITPDVDPAKRAQFTNFSLRVSVDPGPDTSAAAEDEYYNRLSLPVDPNAAHDAGDPQATFDVVERVNRFSNLVQVAATASTFFADPDVFGVPRNLEGGQDGLSAIVERDVTGGEGDLRGLHLFEEIDNIGILCVPDAVFAYQAPKPPPPPAVSPCDPPAPQPAPDPIAADPTSQPKALDPQTIYVRMIEQCERLRDRVAVIDTPRVVRGAGMLLAWRQKFATRFAALYYPWLEVPDALNAQGGTRPIPPSGHVAGIYAYTDNAFGVQRPPANAELGFVAGVVEEIDGKAQENLNPYDINAIRSFRGRGIRVWGARSLANTSDSDWRFIHVRRLMSMIEKSVEKSMQWAVFEPNDFPLRRTLTHSLNVFLEQIWRAGGMKGDQPAKGFFVKCDETNNPQSVIDAGQLVCQVGVAVAAPMEFVIFEIRQGGAQTELLEH